MCIVIFILDIFVENVYRADNSLNRVIFLCRRCRFRFFSVYKAFIKYKQVRVIECTYVIAS